MSFALKVLPIALLLMAIAQPSHAQSKKGWTYRGTTVWDHPDGRQFPASLADTRIKDDSLSIVRNRSDNRWYIVFTYRRSVRFGSGRPYFFIESGPSTAPAAQRTRRQLEGEPRIYQQSGRQTKYIVAQLTKADRVLLRRYTGNLIGVVYSLANSTGPSSSRNYKFYGTDLNQAMNRVAGSSLSPATTIARKSQPADQPRPAISAPPNRSASLIRKMRNYRLPSFNCRRPSITNYRTRRAFSRLADRLNRYNVCMKAGFRRQKQAFKRFHRQELGGTIKKSGSRDVYQIRCNAACGRAHGELINQHVFGINDRRKAFSKDWDRIIRRMERIRSTL